MVMADIAEQNTEKYIPLKEIAARQNISRKYLESIMTSLSKAGLLDCAHGKGGGYRLCRRPEDYSVGEILRLTEKTLAPVSCLGKEEFVCGRGSCCSTLPMWKQLDSLINDFLDGYTIAKIVNGNKNNEEFE